MDNGQEGNDSMTEVYGPPTPYKHSRYDNPLTSSLKRKLTRFEKGTGKFFDKHVNKNVKTASSAAARVGKTIGSLIRRPKGSRKNPSKSIFPPLSFYPAVKKKPYNPKDYVL